MIKYCAICGNVIKNDYIEHEGKYYCKPCFDDNFSVCMGCLKFKPLEDLVYVETANGFEYYCKECYKWIMICDVCGEKISDGEGFYLVEDDRIVCELCYDVIKRLDNWDKEEPIDGDFWL